VYVLRRSSISGNPLRTRLVLLGQRISTRDRHPWKRPASDKVLVRCGGKFGEARDAHVVRKPTPRASLRMTHPETKTAQQPPPVGSIRSLTTSHLRPPSTWYFVRNGQCGCSVYFLSSRHSSHQCKYPYTQIHPLHPQRLSSTLSPQIQITPTSSVCYRERD
jgi:hypothetical protein